LLEQGNAHGNCTQPTVFSPIALPKLIDYHVDIATSKFFPGVPLMNTQKSKPAKDQGKNAVQKKAQKVEDTQKSCKNGVCELTWKPNRPHAA
jgi:hypothetical protein